MERRNYLKMTGISIGGIFFSGSIIGFFDSCRYREIIHEPYLLFNETQTNLVNELAELFIPRTHIPGAKDVKVGQRIDAALYYNYEKEDQLSFLSGLEWVQQLTLSRYDKSFEELHLKEKEEVLTALKVDALQNKDTIYKHVYPLLKGLTVIAYFTSETIAKNYLLHAPIPGRFEGDVPYEAVNGMWSIDL